MPWACFVNVGTYCNYPVFNMSCTTNPKCTMLRYSHLVLHVYDTHICCLYKSLCLLCISCLLHAFRLMDGHHTYTHSHRCCVLWSTSIGYTMVTVKSTVFTFPSLFLVFSSIANNSPTNTVVKPLPACVVLCTLCYVVVTQLGI